MKIIQRRGGWPSLEITVDKTRVNPPDSVPEKAPSSEPTSEAARPERAVGSEQLANGVYRIGGRMIAVAVEFTDHVVVVEGPDSESRALQIIAEASRLVPNKPIRYVVNTHHHFDHAGGLRAFAAIGAIIVTHENNGRIIRTLLNAPHTLQPDVLSRSGRTAQVEVVRQRRILSDGRRTIELHHIPGLKHADGMLIAYLPVERIVIQADMAFDPLPADWGRWWRRNTG